MMQSSRPIPIIGETRLQLLARFEQHPEQAKAIAKGAGVSEITLHDWATTFKTTGDLGEPPPEPPPNRDGPRQGGRTRGFPPETRLVAAQAYLNGKDSAEAVGERFGTSGRSILSWAQSYQEGKLQQGEPSKTKKRDMTKERVHQPPELRYEIGKAVLDGEIRNSEAAKKFGVHISTITGWVKQVREKKLKPPRGKPGPKPRAVPEIVEEYGQTSLALPTAPRTQLARVTTTHDEIARLKAENERLKYVLRKTQAMLLGDD